MTSSTHTAQRSVRVEVRREADTLLDVARQLTVLDDLWVMTFALARYRDGLAAVEGWPLRPTNFAVRRQSPLVVDIGLGDAVPLGLGGASLGLFVYLLRHPEEMGSFLPNVVLGWRRGWTRAEAAQRDRVLARLLEEELTGPVGLRGQEVTARDAHRFLALDRLAMESPRAADVVDALPTDEQETLGTAVFHLQEVLDGLTNVLPVMVDAPEAPDIELE